MQEYDSKEAEAVFQRALDYRAGRGRERDLVKAEQLYLEAIELGSTKALVNLGTLYYIRCSELNKTEQECHRRHFELNMRAGELGQAAGYLNVAGAYFRGNGVPASRADGFKYMTKAAEMGFPRAQYQLGQVLISSEGKLEEGMAWLHKALDNGYGDAAQDLALKYAVILKQSEEYLPILKRGAMLGSSDALSSLNTLFDKGKFGYPKNSALAECYDKLLDVAMDKWDYITKSPGITFPDLDERCPPDMKDVEEKKG